MWAFGGYKKNVAKLAFFGRLTKKIAILSLSGSGVYLILEPQRILDNLIDFWYIVENIVALLDVVASPWQTVRDMVCAECNNFGTAIFDAVGYEGFFDGYACLTVPDSFRATWLDSHYKDLLRKHFAQVLGPDFKDYKVRLLAPSEAVPEIKLTPTLPPVVRTPRPVAKKVTRRDLHLYKNNTFENFVAGECNTTALRACESVVEHPGDPDLNPLLIYGASGLGKTHLQQSIAARLHETRPELKIVYRQAYDFLRDSAAIGDASYAAKSEYSRELMQQFKERYLECDVLLIDDIQLIEKGVKSQERLALLIKHLRSQGKQVVLTCDRHPSSFKRLQQGERPARDSKVPQLSAILLSHLENCVAVGLDEPDLNTRMNLIRKKSEDLPFAEKDREEICRFLSIPPRANVRLIEGTLNWLRAMHTFNGVELNLECVKQLLVSPQNDGAVLTLKNISETVAASFKVDMVVLSSKRQDKGASIPRKIAMFLCRELTTESLQNVGKIFNRDYATVIAAIQSLTSLMDKDEALARQVNDLRYMLET